MCNLKTKTGESQVDKALEAKKVPYKVLAVELKALNPTITAAEMANRLKVSKTTVDLWVSDPNFIDACYERYMIEFGGQLPSVLNAMVREAQAGNVQAGRLVLEHSGKLVKNINITVDSPFEKFLKQVPDAEEVLDADIIEAAESLSVDFKELPTRNTSNQNKRVKDEKIRNIKAIKKEEKLNERNKKQREWYKWRRRAVAARIEPLKNRRPTPAQRKEREEKIIKAESQS